MCTAPAPSTPNNPASVGSTVRWSTTPSLAQAQSASGYAQVYSQVSRLQLKSCSMQGRPKCKHVSFWASSSLHASTDKQCIDCICLAQVPSSLLEPVLCCP